MITFKDITFSDKNDIDACLEGNTYRACDFCFANLYTWNTRFKTLFVIQQETLFMRFEELDGQIYYMMPVGKMRLKDALNIMLQDAEENNIPFQMKGISDQMWAEIETEMPQKFEFIHDRNNDEYIYLSEKLINLSGKKLQSKRNHINRFKKDNPNWHYFPLTTTADYIECIHMLDEWEGHNRPLDDNSLKYDYIATKMMLNNFDELQLKGGAIRVNGKMVAFTIGEPLTQDTFVVHVEKAYNEINGAYTIINQQFIENEASEFKYINREEDMGVDNLRKAKMSYEPEILLLKGIVKLKS